MAKLWLQHTVVFLFIIAGPIWDYFAFKRLKANPTTRAKVRFYQQIIAVQWVLSAVILAVVGPGIFHAPPPFHWMNSAASKSLGLGIAIGIVVGLVFPFLTLRKPKARNAILKAFRKLDFFLPTRTGEFGWFGVVCITAGVCEEWLTRGFLFRYFGQTPWHLGIPAAFALAVVIFGFNHIYQGWSGVLSTSVVGAVMGLLYLWTGSLLVPMIVHALIDLRALFLLKAVQPAAAPGQALV